MFLNVVSFSRFPSSNTPHYAKCSILKLFKKKSISLILTNNFNFNFILYRSSNSILFYSYFNTGTLSTIHRQRVDNGLNSINEKSSKASPFNPYDSNKWTKPFFDISIPNNVTALVGKSAYLTCRVRNLGNYTVSLNLCFQTILYTSFMYMYMQI